MTTRGFGFLLIGLILAPTVATAEEILCYSRVEKPVPGAGMPTVATEYPDRMKVMQSSPTEVTATFFLSGPENQNLASELALEMGLSLAGQANGIRLTFDASVCSFIPMPALPTLGAGLEPTHLVECETENWNRNVARKFAKLELIEFVNVSTMSMLLPIDEKILATGRIGGSVTTNLRLSVLVSHHSKSLTFAQLGAGGSEIVVNLDPETSRNRISRILKVERCN